MIKTGSPLAGLRRVVTTRPPPIEGERCEMCAEPIGRGAPARGEPGEPRTDVHLPGVLSALHRRGLPSFGTAPYPTAICRSRTSTWMAGSTTSWRSRSTWRSCFTTRCWVGWWPSIPARRARPSRSCRWRPGPGSSRRIPSWGCCGRTSRPCSSAAPIAATSSPAIWCRSTPATNWSAGSACCGGGSTAARRCGQAIEEFFAAVARAGPPRAGDPGAGPMTRLSFAVIDMVAEPYAVAPQLTARLRIEESTGEQIHAIALRCQVRIEPQRRRYTEAEEAGLLALFGGRTRWRDTLRPFLWMHCNTMVQGFQRSVRGRPAAALHVRLRGDRLEVPACADRGCHPASPCSSPARSSPRAPAGSASSRWPGTARRPIRCPWRSGSR